LEGQLFAEFEQIANKRQKPECMVATLERNREQNRFKDVVPYDDNRVRITPTRTNPDGYINASHIKVCSDTCLLCDPYVVTVWEALCFCFVVLYFLKFLFFTFSPEPSRVPRPELGERRFLVGRN